MRYQSEAEFAKTIKEQGAKGLILLCGSEDFLIQNWRRQVLKEFGTEESFNLQKLDGQAPDLDALYDATQMLPVFATQKCVYLADLDSSKLHAAEQKKLEEIFELLPPETTLLITARAPHFDGKSAAGKKLTALADRYGGVLELNGRDKSSMVKYLQSGAKSYGATLSAEMARSILDICETDMQSLDGEIAKIASYAGGEAITQAHIDAVASPRTEAKIFDLGRAITNGNASAALEILADLFYQRETPVGINATLIMSYTDLYRAKVAQAAGKTQQDVTALFHYKGREFRVRNAFNTRMSLESVRRSLGHLYQCERELKGSSLDGQFVLEKTVLALLASREG